MAAILSRPQYVNGDGAALFFAGTFVGIVVTKLEYSVYVRGCLSKRVLREKSYVGFIVSP